MSDGTNVVVPRSLHVISTYVLLEQERWFEKEVDFIAAYLQPGMSVVDVGANVGVYALSMARRVGPNGHIFAFEPASETQSLLAAGVKANRLTNVTVVAAALSDRPGQAVLKHGLSSELNALTTDESGEAVTVTTLDAEDAAGRWQRIDLLKLDAEGAEEKVIAGGREFLKRHAPLVLFEVKVDTAVSSGRSDAFRALGFSVFRSLPGVPLLVPSAPEAELDPYEINLFAVPQDRMAALAASGLLVPELRDWRPTPDDFTQAARRISETAFYGAFAGSWPDFADLPDLYQAGLAGFSAWRFGQQEWTSRYAALLHAVAAFEAFAGRDANCASLSMLARAYSEAGLRGKAVRTLRRLAEQVIGRNISLPVPFWPVLPRFDSIAPGAQPDMWLRVCVLEQLERSAEFSGVFSRGTTIDPGLLADKPFAHIELERRRVLMSARRGVAVDVPRRLWPVTPDHRNGEVWRHGLVPNTRRHPTR